MGTHISTRTPKPKGTSKPKSKRKRRRTGKHSGPQPRHPWLIGTEEFARRAGVSVDWLDRELRLGRLPSESEPITGGTFKGGKSRYLLDPGLVERVRARYLRKRRANLNADDRGLFRDGIYYLHDGSVRRHAGEMRRKGD